MHRFPLLSGLSLLLSASYVLVATVSTVTAAAAAPPPTSSSYTDPATFRKNILDAHNFYRGEHGVHDVAWNATSATYAANWAKACNFAHSKGPTGENLAAGHANASASVDAWGLERKDYNFRKPTGFSDKTGHFTQLVWSNTTTVGCGVSSCQGVNSTPGFYVVCEYYPPGNVAGSKNEYFKDNVKKQVKGEETDTVASGVTSTGHESREARSLVAVVGIAAIVGFGIGGLKA
ncbi:extracellular SCP domain protein Pry1 [Diplocarpon rosae]|nr:extracellular SCP domain protein Pry1 [Diplocarpon rosae]